MKWTLLWGVPSVLIVLGLILLWFDKIMLVAGLVIGWIIGYAFGQLRARTSGQVAVRH